MKVFNVNWKGNEEFEYWKLIKENRRIKTKLDNQKKNIENQKMLLINQKEEKGKRVHIKFDGGDEDDNEEDEDNNKRKKMKI